MTSHRERLPQTQGGLFLTDGGIETTLIFHEGLDLPLFAAFHLLRDDAGTEALRTYFRRYADIAERTGSGLVFEAATWRASPDWGERLGYDAAALATANRRAIQLLEEVRDGMAPSAGPVVLSGCVGPRGDGYRVGGEMTRDEARAYHTPQIGTFADTAADMICAITMTYPAEAIGVTEAAREAGMPVAISFTVETDGRLPSGAPIGEAIEAVDEATGSHPAYYMINCAHPTHFDHALEAGTTWASRLGGLRANASRMSHAELDEAPELDSGDPVELGARYASLVRAFPGMRVLGGCCGTDHRHVEQIALACHALAPFGTRGGAGPREPTLRAV